jgi:7-cyano-7-deazaguanine synthase
VASISRIKTGILLSGGIDSACLAYWIKPDIAFNINYGQKPAIAERQASSAIAKAIGIKIEFIDIDCSSIGSGDLTNKKPISMAPVSEWWPYRNQLIITLASMKAINYHIEKLIVGAVITDKKHKDGTKDFFKKLNAVISYQEGSIKIVTPAIEMTSYELIQKSNLPDSILGWTHSCHVSNYPCGRCNGCSKHIDLKENFLKI